MGNIIELREKLAFGKYKGLTSAQLLKSAEGTRYLAYIYNQTDIQMDQFVAEALIAAKLVSRNIERRNSKAGGGVITSNVKPQKRPSIVQGSRFEDMLHQAGVKNLSDLERRSVPVVLEHKTIAKGREEWAKLRERMAQCALPTTDEMFQRSLRRQIQSLNRDTDF